VSLVQRLQGAVQGLPSAPSALADGAAYVILKVGQAGGSNRAHLLQAQRAIRAHVGRKLGARLLAELTRGLPQALPRVRPHTVQREPGEFARRELDRLLTGGGLTRAPTQLFYGRGLQPLAHAADLSGETPRLRRILMRCFRVDANAAGGGRY
jgi:hypothetical protein